MPLDPEALCRKALALDPGSMNACLDLGNLLVDRKRFEEARGLFQDALARFPDAPAVWHRYGMLHLWEQKEPEAERFFHQALALNPGYTRARFSLSYLLLRQGRFEEGWLALEARPLNVALMETVTAPRWQGESLAGKSLLIGQEGGFGDMIQLVRYLPLLKARGAARLGLVAQPALKRLFANLPGLDAVLSQGEPLPGPPWDLWTLPFTLPLHCQTRLDTLPGDLPYLRPDPVLVRAWEERLPAPGLRVGLAWKGDPRFENDGDRSLPGLEALAPLLGQPGITFVSLQKGVGEAEEPPQGLALLKPGPWIGDFADTAALLARLDLVITVDSAMAHLAGALGRPCWVLLPHFKTDWRWLTEREDSPWYPGVMRLFRQGPGETWAPAIARAAAALTRFVPGSRGAC